MKQRIRPLSPHLTVYKPQLTSVLSIFHRITGSLIGLSIVLNFILFYTNVIYPGSSFQYCLFFDLFSVLSIIASAFGYFLIFVISFHVINGVRHLSWDLAYGLEIKNLYTTGMIVVTLVSVILIITILI